MTTSTKTAKELFYNKNYNKAFEIFVENKCYYEAGLCCLLLKNKDDAKKFWLKDKKNNLGCGWGLCVLDMIDLKRKMTPSFFQTRAFLEVYLNLLIENDLIVWAENIISSADILVKANTESYKFIGRALFANGYFTLAITFIKKSLNMLYADPEAFLILSQCQFLINDLPNSLDSVNRIINMTPNYFPANVFRKIVKDKILQQQDKL